MFAFREALYVVFLSFLIIFILLISGIMQTPISLYPTNVSNLNLPKLNQTLYENKTYYGFSTFGYCNTNKNCTISGCVGEICQSKYEEPRFSICIIPNKPTPLQLGYSCKCVSNKCQWTK
jgi:eight-cysteine-cluster-containing protein